ncbi:methyltransferase [Pseudomonas syringae]|uniref:methyltransferase n=1 Tax=Pseudomonas syringae TaxID=317 RepID=UPI001F21662F|nr:class I SAM-dependent methyltransferase [Pseudomonas syringae]MCF5709707.1 methyltransferase [Pseudomonas syringae]
MNPMLPDRTALIALAQRLKNGGYRFITPTPLTHQRVNERPENRTALSLRDVFGWSRIIPESMLPVSEAQGLLEAGIVQRSEDGLKSKVRFSSLNDLLLVHSAYPTHDEDSVFFGPDTYRFAQSISRHLQSTSHPIKRAVDIGCGTGAGGLLIAHARREAQVHAVDINPKALHFAQINADVAGLENLTCSQSDILTGLTDSFDLIVANPPYMKDTQKRAYRHGGDSLGADLSVRIVRESVDRLTPGGSLLLYTGVAMTGERDPFFEAVKEVINHAELAWTYRELDPDVFGEELLEEGYEDAERIAAVELVVTRRK